MADKKKNIDDLWSAINALTENINGLKTSLETSQKSLEDKFVAKVELIKNDISELKQHLTGLSQENGQLKQEVKVLKVMLNQTRQEKLNSNMLIRGLFEAEKKQVDLELITSLCISNVDPLLNANKIQHITRIGKKMEGKVRPILVEFSHPSVRDNILNKKKILKSMTGADVSWEYGDLGKEQVYFDEHLTKENANIFARARGLKKMGFKYIWVKRGRILGRLNEGGKIVNFWTNECVSAIEKKLTTVNEAKRRASSSPSGANVVPINDPELSPIIEELNIFGNLKRQKFI